MFSLYCQCDGKLLTLGLLSSKIQYTRKIFCLSIAFYTLKQQYKDPRKSCYHSAPNNTLIYKLIYYSHKLMLISHWLPFHCNIMAELTSMATKIFSIWPRFSIIRSISFFFFEKRSISFWKPILTICFFFFWERL